MDKKHDDAPRAGSPPQRLIYGLSRRAWLLIGAVLGLILFRSVFFSSSDAGGHYTATPGLLTASDYLNASASDPPPFDFCPVFGPNDEVAERRGQLALLKTRLHLGSGARIQRVLHKAMAGQPITISVLGGSVSACHGAGDDPISPRCWPSRFFNWWNSVFPHPLSELANGAARKTDSAYFAYCSQHHMPDEVDLVILELDASDPNDPLWINHFELLVRSILTRPDQPAVLLLGHFAPQVLIQNGFTGPELLHDAVAQYYDVPHISMKGALYADYMADPEGTRQKYYTDNVLASPAGHEFISDALVSYFQQQICAGWAAVMGHAFDVPYMGANELAAGSEELEAEGGGLGAKNRALRVPQARLSDRPSDILKFREVRPFCVVAHDLINQLSPTAFEGTGWKPHHPGKGAAEEERHYWTADEGGARLTIPLNISAGEVAIYYLQNPDSDPLGRVACWVDDDYANRVELRGTSYDVDNTTPTLTTINEEVPAGEHFVECVMAGKAGQKYRPFKMLGVFAT